MKLKKHGINRYAGRYPFMRSRRTVWSELVRYVKKDLDEVEVIVELGTGYCDFINQFHAKRKIGYEVNFEMAKFADPDVELHIEDAMNVGKLGNQTADVVFASNFLEHLDETELDLLLPNIYRVLKCEGRLVLIQPNYRLCKDRYFDDPTHKTVFTDESIVLLLKRFSFRIKKIHSGLLPLTVQSPLPKWAFLVRLYLLSPVKPMAGQMYVVATKD